MKLEEEIKKMQKYSEENEELRTQLSKAKSKLTEQEKKLMDEKDSKIEELAKTLSEREDKYKSLLREFSNFKNKISKEEQEEYEKMMAEKERELEKINHMNASYRAQLIELKISMSKTRDLGRFANPSDEHEIMVKNSELALEEAKEKIVNLEDKVKEQDSIIETLLAQSDYYKDKYGKDIPK